MAIEFKIGANIAGLVTLASLNIREPLDDPLPYAAQRDLSGGNIIGLGLPQVTWHWTIIYETEYTTLKSYCSGISGPIAIRTRSSENVWVNYTGRIIFPPRKQFTVGRLLDFTILFRQLVLVP